MLATHNLKRAAEAYGAEFLLGREVTAIRRDEEKVLGITLDGDEEIDAHIVVNVAGPHSFVINQMAGVESGMNIKTKALRQWRFQSKKEIRERASSQGNRTKNNYRSIT